jgi:hypothetical protein
MHAAMSETQSPASLGFNPLLRVVFAKIVIGFAHRDGRVARGVELASVTSAWRECVRDFGAVRTLAPQLAWKRPVAAADLPMISGIFSPESINFESSEALADADIVLATVTTPGGMRLLRSLTTVNFKGCARLSNATLAFLASNAPHLRSVDLTWCMWVTPAGLQHLVRPPLRLETLRLVGCEQVSRDHVAVLRGCPTLRSLNVRGNNGGVNVEGIELLLGSSGQQPSSSSPSASLASSPPPPLVELDLSGAEITDQSLALIARSLAGTLTSLALCGVMTHFHTDLGVASLRRLKLLEFLDLSFTGMPIEAFERLFRSSSSTSSSDGPAFEFLHSLVLVGASMTDASLRYLFGLKSLRFVDLTNTFAITAKGVDAFIMGKIRTLRELKIRQCAYLSPSDIARLQAKYVLLKIDGGN